MTKDSINNNKGGAADDADAEADADQVHRRPLLAHYGCFFAVLPTSPTIPPSALKNACVTVVNEQLLLLLASSNAADDDCLITAFSWTHDRIEELHHPQLPDPLPYLEISGILTLKSDEDESSSSSNTSNNCTRRAEAICQEIIVNALLKHHDDVVGNAEILLVLADTVIPVMDSRSIPVVDGCMVNMHNNDKNDNDDNYTDRDVVNVQQLFHTWGVAMLTEAVRDEADLIELETCTMRQFEQLYSVLLKRTDGRRHFKEIMARDQNRFDFRLDCGKNSTAVDDNDDDDNESLVWKRLGKSQGQWVPVVRELLGDDCVLIRCGCVLSFDGTGVQYWHSDGVHVGASLSLSDDNDAAAPVHALCVFVPLINLDESTGYTEFWAGSHQYGKLLSKKGEQALPGGTKGKIKRGSCLLYDYRTIHRGMPNSSGKARPVTYFLYTRAGFEFVEDQNFTETSVFD